MAYPSAAVVLTSTISDVGRFHGAIWPTRFFFYILAELATGSDRAHFGISFKRGHRFESSRPPWARACSTRRPAMSLLGSGGTSESWGSYKTCAMRSFESYRVHDPAIEAKLPHPFDDLRVGHVCQRSVWEGFASFMFDKYIIPEGSKNSGGHLACSTAIGYLNAMLNVAKGKFAAVGTAEVKLFFTCLDGSSQTAESNWLRGLRNNMLRLWFERAKQNGDEMDMSAEPLYIDDMKSIVECYSMYNTSEVCGLPCIGAACTACPPPALHLLHLH